MRLWQELSLLIESSSMAAGDKPAERSVKRGSGPLSKASSWASFDEPAGMDVELVGMIG